MEVALALLADASNATANNKLNVLGVFTMINAPALPHRHPAMTLVLKFDADPVEAGTTKAIQVVLLDPDGRELTKLDIQAMVPQPGQPGAVVEMLLQLGMNGLRFEQAGPHAFVVIVNGETKRRVPLNIVVHEAAQVDGGGADGNAN